MTRRAITLGLAVLLALASVGDAAVHAASCTPYEYGTCHACKNCRACGHCAKRGGKCSVCR